MGQRTGSKSGKARHLYHHEPGRAQLDEVRRRSRPSQPTSSSEVGWVVHEKGKHRGIQIMKGTRSRIAVFAIGCIVVSAMACQAESPAVKNCTWCHGTSAQGYTPAPRLAGQRSQYLENQLAGFRTHARDNPLSQQYMWGAVANLNAQSARDLATYFSTLPPKAASDGDMEPVAAGRAADLSSGDAGRQYRGLRCLSWAECGRGWSNSSLGGAGVFVFEEDARTVGPGISLRLRASDAGYREQIVAEPD